VIQWYGDGLDTLMNDAKMCMMICGVANQPSMGNEDLGHAVEDKIQENR
jgi:hypothetical protein